MTQRQAFWMVYGIGQRAPAYMHVSEHAAEREAERLALAVPGVEFVVMEAKRGVKKQPPPPPPLDIVEYVDFPF